MTPVLSRLSSRAALLLLAMLTLGCHGTAPLTGANRPPLAKRTYLLHFPGIAGKSLFDVNWVKGLGEAGVADHLEVYDWVKPYWCVGALHAYDHNRAEARVIANAIAAKLRREPDAQIVLTAWSGGCQIVVWALEDLPPGVTVRSAVMIAPSIRPDYNLTRALSHVRGSMFAATSPGDWLVLGWGTSVFGTSDGVHVNAAGMVGFVVPKGAGGTQYLKLRQLRYVASWLRYGNLGDHNGGVTKAFATDYLAPLLCHDAPDADAPNADVREADARDATARQ